MANTDLKKLEVAIKYIERMADGKNPVNNQAIDEDTIVNDPNVIRCFFFVADVLKRLYEKEVKAERKKAKKESFPFEILKNYEYRQDQSVSQIMKQVNEMVESDNVEKLSYTTVIKWLKFSGYLAEEYNEELNKKITLPTQKGKELGIYSEKRENAKGEQYFAIIYNEEAQKLLVNKLEIIF